MEFICDAYIKKRDVKGYVNCVISTLGLKSGDECMGACAPFAHNVDISQMRRPVSPVLTMQTTLHLIGACDAEFAKKGIKSRNPASIGNLVSGLGKVALVAGAVAGTVTGIGAVVAGVGSTAMKLGAGMKAKEQEDLSQTVPQAQKPAIRESLRQAKNPCTVKEVYEEPTEPYRV